ncbi:2',3'-cyclic-nucleotide 3'-phosphodiesterase [Russula emetica]|nr:2',3'-cyclic-nucleotide 3'-phosphodiesterase [Russula emetica]
MSRHPNPSVQHSFPYFHPHVTLSTIRPPPPTTTTGSRPDEREEGEGTYDHDHNNNILLDSDSTTLLALALRESIPIGQRAIRIRFARVLTGDKYFLSIYIALAPSNELAQLRSSALAVGVGGASGNNRPDPEKASPAFPHLSLFYIADEEAHSRVRLMQEMEREGVIRHSADGLSVALRCAQIAGDSEDGDGDGGNGVLEGFTATQVWIVDCEGPVEEWKVLDKILLATSDR